MNSEPKAMDLQTQLEKLKQEYLRKIPDRIKKLRDEWQNIDNKLSLQSSDLESFHTIIHNIQSTLRLYEFPAEADLARTLENWLVSHHDATGKAPMSKADKEKLAQHYSSLFHSLEAIAPKQT